MLSERGIQILEILIENNKAPITSKVLAAQLGISERSVKTYVKEVSDFCEENSMIFVRKPGIGFVADFTEEQIENVNELKKDKKTVMSKKQRMNYITYILLSGWSTYTLSLFSEELGVSKNVISEDVNSVSHQLEKFGITTNRVSGHGIYVTGDEFSIRRAMRHCCSFPIGNKEICKEYDVRISTEEAELWINNFGQDNFEKAIDIIRYVERKFKIPYTDYSFRMLAEYLSIQIYRIRMDNTLTQSLPKYDTDNHIGNDAIVNTVSDKILEMVRVNVNEYEKQYIDVIFASATPQSTETGLQTINSKEFNDKNPEMCQRMVEYLSEILNSNLNENDLFNSGIRSFMPASLVRTKFGIEVTNPFLGDIKEMYSGIFAVCFTLTKFYEDYVGGIPTDHEISFVALLVGGALHRNAKTVRAVLIGTSGIAAANIVARTIENKIEDIEIVAILSSEKMKSLEDYEFDIVLSMLQNFEYEDKVVDISPIITKADEKRIKDKCFEILSHPELQKEGFSKLVDINNILYIEEKLSKEEILKLACDKLLEGGFVTEKFYDDVIRREDIESTGIGNCVAIPHGTPANVVEPKVFIVRLAYPVAWGFKNVDTIFLLALNFNNINTTKAFFHDFARLLGNEEKIGRIRKTDSISELEKALKEELHWY